jgi:hypothetical protein
MDILGRFFSYDYFGFRYSLFKLGEITLLTVCWSHRDENPQQVQDLCGSEGGALAMIIIGTVFFPFVSCCGLALLNMRTLKGYVDMKKMTEKQTANKVVS